MTVKSHRETYPEQYTHPCVGQAMRHKKDHTISGTVERVFDTRWGLLAKFEDGGDTADMAFAITDLEAAQ